MLCGVATVAGKTIGALTVVVGFTTANCPCVVALVIVMFDVKPEVRR
jgi:hypothetical protein